MVCSFLVILVWYSYQDNPGLIEEVMKYAPPLIVGSL